MKDYFDSFLLKKPQGKILDGKINIGEGWASDAGIYEVSYDASVFVGLPRDGGVRDVMCGV